MDFMYSAGDYARECVAIGVLLIHLEHCGNDYDATGGACEKEKEDGDPVWAVFDYRFLDYIFLAGRNL